MEKARQAIRKYCPNTKEEDQIWDMLNAIRVEAPFSRIFDGKYLAGVIRLIFQEELEFAQIDEINTILEIISQDQSLSDKYDYDFNGLYFEELHFEFNDKIEDFVNREKRSLGEIVATDNEYTIVPIHTFEEASQFAKYTDWCITKSNFDFESYTSAKQSFYFCYKKGFELMIEPKQSCSCMDDYGLSLIAVSVYQNRRLSTSTTRWNEGSGGNKTLSIVKISELIGKNFYDVFVPFD